MRRGLNDAATRPEEIALLETDGSARPSADQQQVQALLAVQSAAPRQHPLLVSSVVGQIGHAGGASGMASLLKAVLEIEHREVPRTVGLETPLPLLTNGQNHVQAALQPSPIKTLNARNRPMAAVNSCSKDLVHHVILEAGTAVPQRRACFRSSRCKGRAPFGVCRVSRCRGPAADWQIVRVGAASLDELLKKLSAASAEALFAAAARSRFSAADRFRVAIVAASPATLAEKLSSAAKMLADPATWPALAQRGIFCRQLGLHRPRIAFLFPGQGSQYPGMLRELVRDVPAAAAAMRAMLRDHGPARVPHAGRDRLVGESAVRRRRVSDADFDAGGRCGDARGHRRSGNPAGPGGRTQLWRVSRFAGGRGLGRRAGAPRDPCPLRRHPGLPDCPGRPCWPWPRRWRRWKK